MKRNGKLLTCFLATLISLSCVLSACKQQTNSSGTSTNDGGVYDSTVQTVEKDVYQGTHILTAPDTDKPFIVNGTCAYSLVVPEVMGTELSFAAQEFTTFFREATGIELKIVSDADFDQVGGKYISLGETSQLATSGISLDRKKLTNDGVRIVTKDDNIYLVGGSDYGSLYAVYTFLEIYFDFDVYYRDCYDLKKGVRNAKLKAFDVTDIPDLEFRCNSYWSLITGDWAYRFRYPRGYASITFYIRKDVSDPTSPSKHSHNSTYWLPPEQFGTEHPGWYSANRKELCYTAHGDPEEYDLMVQAAAEKALGTLMLYDKETYPYHRILNFTQEDGPYNCECEACMANKAKYGSDTSSVILFMKDLRAAIESGMKSLDEKYRRDDLTLTFFAYQWSETAPDDSYPEMHLGDGVSVFLATAETFDPQSPIYSDKNKHGRDNLKNWGKVSDEIILWTYATSFKHFLYPVDTFSFYSQDAFSFFAANNVKIYYNQSQNKQRGTTTAWHNLKAYLDAKLEWDTSRNAEEYIDKYMTAMYGSAAPYMKKMYQDVRLQSGIVKTKTPTNLIGQMHLDKKEYWPFLTVKSWLKTLDKAYEAIEEYRYAAPDAYKKYKLHIDAEWISPAYMILSLYPTLLDNAELNAMKAKFRQVVAETGITNTYEQGDDGIQLFIETF